MTIIDMYYHLWTVAQLCGIGMPGLVIIAAVLWMGIYSALMCVYFFAMRSVL